LIVDDINGVDGVTRVTVEEFLVFVDLPENALSVEAAGDNSVLRVRIDSQNISSMPIVRVDILHLS